MVSVADGCAAGVAATTRSRTNRLLTEGPPISTDDGAPAVNDRGGLRLWGVRGANCYIRTRLASGR